MLVICLKNPSIIQRLTIKQSSKQVESPWMSMINSICRCRLIWLFRTWGLPTLMEDTIKILISNLALTLWITWIIRRLGRHMGISLKNFTHYKNQIKLIIKCWANTGNGLDLRKKLELESKQTWSHHTKIAQETLIMIIIITAKNRNYLLSDLIKDHCKLKYLLVNRLAQKEYQY